MKRCLFIFFLDSILLVWVVLRLFALDASSLAVFPRNVTYSVKCRFGALRHERGRTSSLMSDIQTIIV